MAASTGTVTLSGTLPASLLSMPALSNLELKQLSLSGTLPAPGAAAAAALQVLRVPLEQLWCPACPHLAASRNSPLLPLPLLPPPPTLLQVCCECRWSSSGALLVPT